MKPMKTKEKAHTWRDITNAKDEEFVNLMISTIRDYAKKKYKNPELMMAYYLQKDLEIVSILVGREGKEAKRKYRKSRDDEYKSKKLSNFIGPPKPIENKRSVDFKLKQLWKNKCRVEEYFDNPPDISYFFGKPYDAIEWHRSWITDVSNEYRKTLLDLNDKALKIKKNLAKPSISNRYRESLQLAKVIRKLNILTTGLPKSM